MTSESKNPATNESIGTFPLHDAAHVASCIELSRNVQKEWAALPWKTRSQAIGRVGNELVENVDKLAFIISKDNGKTRVDALATEILPAAMAISFYQKAGKRILKPTPIRGGNILMFNKRSTLRKIPWGVVGIISPWNYPFAIPFSEIIMALLAGNGVILKVATDTLAVGQALEDLFAGAGLPPGLFAYVNIPGSLAGSAFIDGGVDKLFFTGSTAVGKQLMTQAASRLMPLVLELGGNDAVIVRADADLDRTISGIVWAGFSNAGQSCGGVQRVFVHTSIYPVFCERLAKRVASLRVGPGDLWDSDIGCMTSAKQKSAVEAQIASCLSEGAHILAQASVVGGVAGNTFLAPTVLIDVPSNSVLMRDEVFGPVMAIIPVSSDEKALERANDSPYGLTGSVWSRDRKAAKKIASHMKAGAVTINDHLMSHGLGETPWGGFGDSGLGRTHGIQGFMEMVKTQVIIDDILPGEKKAIWWYPYSEKLYLGLRALLIFLYAKKITRRIASIPQVLKVFIRYWEK